MGRQSPEHKIQVAICDVLTYGLPKGSIFWAVPNGGSRSKFTAKNGRTFSLEAKRLKDEGVKPGVSDLMILCEGRLICLEVKTEKGRQSPAQKEWEREVTAAGGLYRVVRSTDDVRTFLTMVIPTFRARLGKNSQSNQSRHTCLTVSGEEFNEALGNDSLAQPENDIDAWLKGEASNEAKGGRAGNKAA